LQIVSSDRCIAFLAGDLAQICKDARERISKTMHFMASLFRRYLFLAFTKKIFKQVAVERCECKAVQAQELVAIDGMKGVGELRLVERVREGLFVL